MKNRETDEWLAQNQKATREFIRKWGHFVKHDNYLKPIIPPKYDIGIIMPMNNIEYLRALEPWCSTIYCDSNLGNHYKSTDQQTTSFDLSKRVLPYNNEKQNNILIELSHSCTQQDFECIFEISQILANDTELDIGTFQLGNLQITINDLSTYEYDLIICK